MTAEGHGDGVMCPICRERRSEHEILPGGVLNDATQALVRALSAGWTPSMTVCTFCLHQARADASGQEATDDPPMPARRMPHEEIQQLRTLGERVSDRIASFVGSWAFLNTQMVLLLIWIVFNSIAIFKYHFDPYPFILLNLVLSWIAALQAPLILMSQNRQDTRDRLRDESEYRTNLAAEREVRQLHEKLDHLTAGNTPMLEDIHRQLAEMTARLNRLHFSTDDHAG